MKVCRTVYFDAGDSVMVPIKICEKLTDYCQHYIEKTKKKFQGQKKVIKFKFQLAFCHFQLKNAKKSAEKEARGLTLNPAQIFLS